MLSFYQHRIILKWNRRGIPTCHKHTVVTKCQGAFNNSTHHDKDLESVERRRTAARHGASDAARYQVAPPHARHHLALGEVVGHQRVLADVNPLSPPQQQQNNNKSDVNRIQLTLLLTVHRHVYTCVYCQHQIPSCILAPECSAPSKWTIPNLIDNKHTCIFIACTCRTHVIIVRCTCTQASHEMMITSACASKVKNTGLSLLTPGLKFSRDPDSSTF